MNRFASQLGDKGRRLRAAGLVGIAALISGALIAPPAHALVAAGPIGAGATAGTGLPSWYEDNNSLSLQPCLDAVNCPGTAVNFPLDGAYFQAIARPASPNAIDLSVSLNSGQDVKGGFLTFERFRLNVAHGLVPGSQYTVTYPYGTKTFTADVNGAIVGRGKNAPAQIITGCTAAPCDFNAVLDSEMTNFLTWDPAVTPAAPAGFIGDGVTLHTVVGSPTGHNFVKIDGLNIGGPGINTVSTDLFLIQGQIATGPFTAPAAPAFTAAAGPNAGEATIAWPKVAADGGSKVTAYRVYAGDTAGSLSLLQELGANARSFTESGLDSGITRYYAVTAVNAVGETALASITPQSIVTFTRPSVPRDVAAAPGDGLATINLSWTAPASNGGAAITAYQIYRALGTGGYSLLTTVGNVHSFTDSQLIPLMSYHYLVAAVNVVGASDSSSPACSRANPWASALDSLLPC